MADQDVEMGVKRREYESQQEFASNAVAAATEQRLLSSEKRKRSSGAYWFNPIAAAWLHLLSLHSHGGWML
jgi:hypothetical protein